MKYATHFRNGHAPTPNYTNQNHHSTVVPGHAERLEQDLRMPITGSQQLEEEWFAGGRAGGWVGGHQQVARAHAIPQGAV